jgi:hypothetical protein
VGFELAPDPGDRGEPGVKQGRTGGAAIGEQRLVENGLQVLARGAFVCPSCSLPISPAPRVRPRAIFTCGFCDHASIALDFLCENSLDAPANEVILVARVV